MADSADRDQTPERSDRADEWRPTASWASLRRRAELLAWVRVFFAEREFLEVETPLVSADTVVDRHLDPFAVMAGPAALTVGNGSGGRPLWLQTSPEFGMKRLMAAGGEAIYQVTRAFRQEELGPLHNPEFTIVEWYRRGDDLAAGMKLLSDLCETLLSLGPAATLSYRDAFVQHAGVDPFLATDAELADVARDRGVIAPGSLAANDRDGWLDLLLVSLVEPQLGQKSPTILHSYPPSQAALAVTQDTQPRVAERFELYVRGIELANGYHELLDPAILRERNRQNNAARQADGKPALPSESRLLRAMEHGLPACAGAALGFDRLVMLATGAKTIAEVIAFP
jgi:lysyl-tRNA synthetase class 2